MKEMVHRLCQSLSFDVIRYKKEQKSRRSDRLDLCQTKLGDFFVPADAKGDVIAAAIRNGVVYDEPIYEVAAKYIKADTIALDIGSNFGQMAIMMSRHVGEHGMVHAFEADDFVFNILKKNIQQNASKVVAHCEAVHNKSNDTLYFPIQDFKRFQTYGSYGIDYKNGQGRPVHTLKIDDLEFERPVSFIKIDVQGGDLFAMQGAVETINRYRMPIIFEYEWLFEEEQDLCFQQYVDFVRDINYRFARIVQGQNYLILPAEKASHV